MLTTLDIPHRYLRSLFCVGVVGLIMSVERGAAVFDVNRDVHGTRRRQRGPGQQCLRLIGKWTRENPNFDSECFC